MGQAADCIMEYETGQHYVNNSFAHYFNTKKPPYVNYLGFRNIFFIKDLAFQIEYSDASFYADDTRLYKANPNSLM